MKLPGAVGKAPTTASDEKAQRCPLTQVRLCCCAVRVGAGPTTTKRPTSTTKSSEKPQLLGGFAETMNQNEWENAMKGKSLAKSVSMFYMVLSCLMPFLSTDPSDLL